MPDLYVMMGVPASGKTTSARKIVAATGATHIESDAIRALYYPEPTHTKSESEQVFAFAHDILEQEMKAGHNVVFDATNIRAWQREAILKYVPAGYRTHCMFHNIPLVECVARHRERGDSIPEETIERMYDTLEPPQYGEGWDEIFEMN